MTTSTAQELRDVLNNADPNLLADALRKVKLGRMLDPLKITVVGIAASATLDLTAQSIGDSTLTQNLGDIPNGEALPPAMIVKTLRVTGGAAAAGARFMGDVGATPSATVATLSDDGTTIVFEGTVTGFVIEYIPRSNTSTTEAFPNPPAQ